jgi:hypothetical protein
MLTVPYQLTVLVHFPDPVQGDALQHTLLVNDVEGKMIVRPDKDLLQREADNGILNLVVITNDKLSLAKFLILADAAE